MAKVMEVVLVIGESMVGIGKEGVDKEGAGLVVQVNRCVYGCSGCRITTGRRSLVPG